MNNISKDKFFQQNIIKKLQIWDLNVAEAF